MNNCITGYIRQVKSQKNSHLYMAVCNIWNHRISRPLCCRHFRYYYANGLCVVDANEVYKLYKKPDVTWYIRYRLNSLWRSTWIWIHFGSGKGLLPDGTKPLHDSMLTYHQCDSVVSTWEQFHRKYPIISSVTWNKTLHLQNYFHITRGQWVKVKSVLTYIWQCGTYQTFVSEGHYKAGTLVIIMGNVLALPKLIS